MTKRPFLAALALSTLALAPLGAGATTVMFGGYGTTNGDINGGEPLVVPLITANDDAAGRITVSIDIDPASEGFGLLTGIFFDYSDTLGLSDINFPVAIDTFQNNTNNLGSGVSMNGGYSNGADGGLFDVGFNFDPADDDVASNGGIDVTVSPYGPLVFDFADLGLDLSMLDRIGLRFQSVIFDCGTEDCSSDKVVSTTVSTVPVPATGLLLLSALGGLGILMRRRTA